MSLPNLGLIYIASPHRFEALSLNWVKGELIAVYIELYIYIQAVWRRMSGTQSYTDSALEVQVHAAINCAYIYDGYSMTTYHCGVVIYT